MTACEGKLWKDRKKAEMNVCYYPCLALAYRCRHHSLSLLHHHRPVSLSPTFFQKPNFLSGNTIFHNMQRLWSVGGIIKKKAMVEKLERYGVITSSKVSEVMEAIDRALFVPSGSDPYDDSPMAIGYNATISAPHMHATCLHLLEDNLQPGMHALDIGSGSGYLTACFALMVGPQGQAVGVDHIPELVSLSIKNIQKSAAATLLKDGSLSVHVGGIGDEDIMQMIEQF